MSTITTIDRRTKRKRDISPPPKTQKRARRKEPLLINVKSEELFQGKEELVEKILTYVWENGAIRQGTPEWHALLRTTIGGSDMATIVGMNPYKNRKALI